MSMPLLLGSELSLVHARGNLHNSNRKTPSITRPRMITPRHPGLGSDGTTKVGSSLEILLLSCCFTILNICRSRRYKFLETDILERVPPFFSRNKMSAIILYRKFDTSEEEVEVINDFFPATAMRTALPPADEEWLVIGRYSVLPYYQELVRDLKIKNASLINSYQQHEFVADIGEWSVVLGDLTPMTWVQGEFNHLPQDASFVLKGQTNSKKFLWDTHMFAKDRAAVRDVLSRLLDDTLIGSQTIYAREYVPLITYDIALNGLPITKEFRFFVLYGEVLCGGFYWSNFIDDIHKSGYLPDVEEVPDEFLKAVTDRIGDRIPFYVVDVAQAKDLRWLVTDVNDGQMSGLSEIQPRALYMGMSRVLKNRKLL